MKVGGYQIKVTVNAMPQKVATGFQQVFETILGATYNPIAYLGSQVVNGVNHAILAEQTLVAEKEVHNVVLVVINEQPKRSSLLSITPVLTQGAPIGGIAVNVHTKIPEEQKEIFNNAFEGFVGSKVVPFAYLGSQLVNGINYFFAAEVDPLVALNHGEEISTVSNGSIKLITVNSNGTVKFDDILG